MFSVIIPLYNKATYIAKAVQSVIDQSYQEFELIIVNDGSTDKSLEIARQFIDKRIRIIDQTNAGVSSARNNGVNTSIYEYIAFLDADDCWESDYLQQMLELIEEYPNVGLYASSYKLIKNGRERNAQIGVPHGFEHGLIPYFDTYYQTMWMPITSSSIIIPKRIFQESGGFEPNIRFGEDFHLWSRLALNYPVAYCNKPLVVYNQDVDPSQRAVGNPKLYPPAQHFIFNLDPLDQAEKKDPSIKRLLDQLRAESLIRYRLTGAYPDQVAAIMQKIDLNNLKPAIRWMYIKPLWMVKAYHQFKRWGSFFKQKLLRLMYTTRRKIA